MATAPSAGSGDQKFTTSWSLSPFAPAGPKAGIRIQGSRGKGRGLGAGKAEPTAGLVWIAQSRELARKEAEVRSQQLTSFAVVLTRPGRRRRS